MSVFRDVAAFAEQHAACGGLLPRTHSNRDGGYVLAITCPCGATYDRWVTREEALQLPRPGAPAPAPRRPPPTPSPELLAALGEALTEPPLPAAPATAPPSADRRAASVPDATTAAGPPSHGRTSPSAEMEEAIRAAMGAPQTADTSGIEAPRRRAVVVAIVSVACLALVAAAMLWVAQLDSQRPVVSPPAPATPANRVGSPAPPTPSGAPAPGALGLSPDERRALDAALEALRQLQSVSNTGNTFPFYRSRVEMMQDRVRPFLTGRAPRDLRVAVQDVVDVHTLAAEIWSARLHDQPDAWTRVDRRDVLRSCAPVARILEFSERAPGAAGEVRSRVLGSAMPLLWTCSAERLERIDQLLAGR